MVVKKARRQTVMQKTNCSLYQQRNPKNLEFDSSNVLKAKLQTSRVLETDANEDKSMHVKAHS